MKKVKCIINTGVETYLTVGKEYEIKGGGLKDAAIRVISDDGQHDLFFSYRFVEVETEKIIGYKLLKDLPDIKAGSIFTDVGEFKFDGGVTREYGVREHKGAGSVTKASKYTITFIKSNPDWFEPVYEEIKLDFLFSISAGDGSIDKEGTITLVSKKQNYYTNVKQLQEVYKELSKTLKLSNYSVKVNSVHIGCSEGPDVELIDIERIIDNWKKHFES